jgi:hypothetical protein
MKRYRGADICVLLAESLTAASSVLMKPSLGEAGA